jgi:uncharacterized membrane protein YphA (DoxX/SURF4 family)
MYPILLAVHNIVRWVALILAILAAVRAFIGWFGKRDWTDRDRKIGVYFTSAMDTQLLLGLLLYIVFSPITKTVFQDFGAAMSNEGVRFFALEHAFYMIMAVVFAHLGSALSKRADEPVKKHRTAAIWFGLSLIIILIGMPWMRPLLPGL